MIPKYISIFTLGAFLSLGIHPLARADFELPKPGAMVSLSPVFKPSQFKGIRIDPRNPFKFVFIMENGESKDDSKEQAKTLVKYFLTALTTPESDMWVNLSPYEHQRIIPNHFGETQMGRDLLAEDYLLKQITASLFYPEGEVGKQFWAKVYTSVKDTNIAVNTFNKVWIVPNRAKVFEDEQGAFIVHADLKVMLEEDYLSLTKHKALDNAHSKASHVVREIVIPLLEREVNEGQNFASLRQIYNSIILATWFKKHMKDSLLGQKYADQNKIHGIESQTSLTPNAIYQQYLRAFQKGVYNYIKEEQDPLNQQRIPKKYFSGGFSARHFAAEGIQPVAFSKGEVPTGDFSQVAVELDNAMESAPQQKESVEIFRGLNNISVESAVQLLKNGEQPRFSSQDDFRSQGGWILQSTGFLDKDTLSTTSRFSAARMYAFWSYFTQENYKKHGLAKSFVLNAKYNLKQAKMMFTDVFYRIVGYQKFTKGWDHFAGSPGMLVGYIENILKKDPNARVNLIYSAEVDPSQIKWRYWRLGHYLVPSGQEMGVQEVHLDQIKMVDVFVKSNKDLSDRVPTDWKPDNGSEFPKAFYVNTSRWHILEKVNLNELPVGTLIYLESDSNRSNYTLSIEPEGKIRLWIEGSRESFVGSISSLYSKDLQGNLLPAGILLKERGIAFPYFSWEVDKQRKRTLLESTSQWIKSYSQFKVLYPQDQALNVTPSAPGGIDMTEDRMKVEVESNGTSVPVVFSDFSGIEIDGMSIKNIEVQHIENLSDALSIK